MITQDAAAALPRTEDRHLDHGRLLDGVNAAIPAQTLRGHRRRRLGIELAAMRTTNPPVTMIVVHYAHNHLGRNAEGRQTIAASVVAPHHARVRRLAGTDEARHARARHRTKEDGHRPRTTSSPAPIDPLIRTGCEPQAAAALRMGRVDVHPMRSRTMESLLVLLLTRWVTTTNSVQSKLLHPARDSINYNVHDRCFFESHFLSVMTSLTRSEADQGAQEGSSTAS